MRHEENKTEERPIDGGGYRPIRGELLSCTNTPAISFSGAKVYVNTAYLRKTPDNKHIQFLIDPSAKKLILRPCREDDMGAFLLYNERNSKRVPRKTTCRLFTAMLSELMDWGFGCRYRIFGIPVITASGQIMLFDLKAAEVFASDNGRHDGDPFLREERQNRSDISVGECRKFTAVNIFKDYTVFRLNG